MFVPQLGHQVVAHHGVVGVPAALVALDIGQVLVGEERSHRGPQDMNGGRLRVGASFDLQLPSAGGLASVVQGHHRSVTQSDDALLLVEAVAQAKTLAPTGQ